MTFAITLVWALSYFLDARSQSKRRVNVYEHTFVAATVLYDTAAHSIPDVQPVVIGDNKEPKEYGLEIKAVKDTTQGVGSSTTTPVARRIAALPIAARPIAARPIARLITRPIAQPIVPAPVTIVVEAKRFTPILTESPLDCDSPPPVRSSQPAFNFPPARSLVTGRLIGRVRPRHVGFGARPIFAPQPVAARPSVAPQPVAASRPAVSITRSVVASSAFVAGHAIIYTPAAVAPLTTLSLPAVKLDLDHLSISSTVARWYEEAVEVACVEGEIENVTRKITAAVNQLELSALAQSTTQDSKAMDAAVELVVATDIEPVVKDSLVVDTVDGPGVELIEEEINERAVEYVKVKGNRHSSRAKQMEMETVDKERDNKAGKAELAAKLAIAAESAAVEERMVMPEVEVAPVAEASTPVVLERRAANRLFQVAMADSVRPVQVRLVKEAVLEVVAAKAIEVATVEQAAVEVVEEKVEEQVVDKEEVASIALLVDDAIVEESVVSIETERITGVESDVGRSPKASEATGVWISPRVAQKKLEEATLEAGKVERVTAVVMELTPAAQEMILAEIAMDTVARDQTDVVHERCAAMKMARAEMMSSVRSCKKRSVNKPVVAVVATKDVEEIVERSIDADTVDRAPVELIDEIEEITAALNRLQISAFASSTTEDNKAVGVHSIDVDTVDEPKVELIEDNIHERSVQQGSKVKGKRHLPRSQQRAMEKANKEAGDKERAAKLAAKLADEAESAVVEKATVVPVIVVTAVTGSTRAARGGNAGMHMLHAALVDAVRPAQPRLVEEAISEVVMAEEIEEIVEHSVEANTVDQAPVALVEALVEEQVVDEVEMAPGAAQGIVEEVDAEVERATAAAAAAYLAAVERAMVVPHIVVSYVPKVVRRVVSEVWASSNFGQDALVARAMTYERRLFEASVKILVEIERERAAKSSSPIETVGHMIVEWIKEQVDGQVETQVEEPVDEQPVEKSLTVSAPSCEQRAQ